MDTPTTQTNLPGKGGRQGDPGLAEGDQQDSPRAQRLPRLAVMRPCIYIHMRACFTDFFVSSGGSGEGVCVLCLLFVYGLVKGFVTQNQPDALHPHTFHRPPPFPLYFPLLVGRTSTTSETASSAVRCTQRISACVPCTACHPASARLSWSVTSRTPQLTKTASKTTRVPPHEQGWPA